jgi:hypothetical protein
MTDSKIAGYVYIASDIAAFVAQYVAADSAAREEMDIEIDRFFASDSFDVLESVIACDGALTCIMESGREISIAADGTISE